MKKLVLALLLASCFALAGAARADDTDFGRSGAYLGVGASHTAGVVNAFLDGDTLLQHLEISDRWGVNARAGYHLTSWFSIEGEYEWIDPLRVTFFNQSLGDLGIQSATANVRFILPLRRFQPYLLLGAGAVFFDLNSRFPGLSIDRHAFAGRVGLGMDVYITHNLYLNAGAESILTPAKISLNTGLVSGSVSPIGSLSFQLGLGYHF
jgi:opacity protein-like surface antigen